MLEARWIDLKVIFITGITGTLGTELTRQLIVNEGTDIIYGLSRTEQKIKEFPYRDHERVKLLLGDIRSFEYQDYLKDVTHIIHAAALKHVDLSEEFPQEYIKTNIDGTQLLLELCESFKANFIYVSTDKAVNPINAYGMTKALAEKLVLASPLENKVICRYGNVIGSNGSAIKLFIDLIKNDIPISITDKQMTRFWISIEDAAKFIINNLSNISNKVQIPNMRSCYVIDLIKYLYNKLGKTNIMTQGKIRPGEKIHECLGKNYYSDDEESLLSPDEIPAYFDNKIEKFL